MSPPLGAVVAALPVFSVPRGYDTLFLFTPLVGRYPETTIVVEKNKVSERRYQESTGRPATPMPDGGPASAVGVQWVETGDELGKHKEGAAPKTLDTLYEEAQKVVERQRAEYERLALRFDKAGLLLDCYTRDTRIADDAPTVGVSIAEIKLAKHADEQGK